MRLLIVVPILLGPRLTAQSEPAPVRAAETITPLEVMRRIGIIADDSMLGRDNPSRGLELTAKYLAAEFRRLGLRPAGDRGGYMQRFGFSSWTIDTGRSAVELTAGRQHTTVQLGAEARYLAGRIPDLPLSGDVIVVAGTTPLTSELKDRFVLLVLDYSKPLPGSLSQAVFQLAAAGPKAVLLLSNRDSATFAQRLVSAGGPKVTRDSAEGDAMAPIIEIHERTLSPVLTAAGIDPAGLRQGQNAPRIAYGLKVELRLARTILGHAEVPNVIGLLEGKDPTLRREYVVYSAHIDHIGVSPGLPDSINNGADDNASGVAGLLELAEAFSQPGVQPKRSILFLAPSGEEPGLLGSAHFTEHPTVPLQAIVADINMDLIGRNWPDSVIAVGPEQSDLGQTLARVVAAHPELRMTPIADRWPEERIFYRSDHYNFARKGVPILFFTSGTHPDYHRPSDEAERIDGEKESRLVRLLFYLGAEVAGQPSRPKWKPESYRDIVERE
jgi:peptidase M28-like protein